MHNQPNSPAISPLRQRLIDDMNLRHFGHETQRNYLRDETHFADNQSGPYFLKSCFIVIRLQVKE